MRLFVIGGGAAGFFCAVNAARMNPNLQVFLVEKTGKLLSKVKVSGGGRCNVTHACFSIPDMSVSYPRGQHFVKKSFHEFFTTDTIDWFKDRGVRLKTEADGRMFPESDDADTIINCLMREAEKYGVEIRVRTELKGLTKDGRKFGLTFSNDVEERAEFVCLACGGFPKMEMFDWIKALGHAVETPLPSLFTFNIPGHAITGLTGISVKASVKIQGTKLEEEGPVLITHWGLSGPAVLKLSARGARLLAERSYRFVATINWCPSFNEQSLKTELVEWRQVHGAQMISSRNPFALPQRLWEFICGASGIKSGQRWADLPSAQMTLLIRTLSGYELPVSGKTTFKEEFVTAGGVKLSEIEPHTMESRLVPGLFFAGEIMDVDGITGGYNFQHAWTSGWVAANAIAARSLVV